jgi:hypothetical protein
MEELDYNQPAYPPSGTYIIVYDDSNYHAWLDSVQLGESRYCPGCASRTCSIGGYGERLEKLCVAMRILQSSNNEEGMYVVNPMHVLLDTDTPEHLLIVGPFDQTIEQDREFGERLQAQMMAFGFEVMIFYYVSIDLDNV